MSSRYIGDTPFQDLLPSSIAGDKKVLAAAEALDRLLKVSLAAIPDVLLMSRLAHDAGACEDDDLIPPMYRLGRLQGGLAPLPEDVVDLLAWQLHVDGYEYAADLEDKVRLTWRSLLLHRKKGTPWAIREALRALGYADAVIDEGFGYAQHDGELTHDGADTYSSGNRWALFDVQVALGEDGGLDLTVIENIRAVIEEWKNVRSHLRVLSWHTTIEDGDDMTGSDETTLAVVPVFGDTRLWGYPLHNGEIYYDNGVFRAHDGRLAYDGTAVHTRWEPSGWLHNAELDPLAVRVGPVLSDTVRFSALHNAALPHDGQAYYGGEQDVPAVEEMETSLRAICADSVSVRDKGIDACALGVDVRDEVGRYHDGSITHGQRYIHLHNGETYHDGTWARGQYGGLTEFAGVYHDGLAAHDGTALHTVWGWLSTAGDRAPVFTYSALSDSCAPTLQLGMTDDCSITDDLAVDVLRHLTHNGLYAHDGEPSYDGKEYVYAT